MKTSQLNIWLPLPALNKLYIRELCRSDHASFSSLSKLPSNSAPIVENIVRLSDREKYILYPSSDSLRFDGHSERSPLLNRIEFRVRESQPSAFKNETNLSLDKEYVVRGACFVVFSFERYLTACQCIRVYRTDLLSFYSLLKTREGLSIYYDKIAGTCVRPPLLTSYRHRLVSLEQTSLGGSANLCL